jgi:hypothetical protein
VDWVDPWVGLGRVGLGPGFTSSCFFSECRTIFTCASAQHSLPDVSVTKNRLANHSPLPILCIQIPSIYMLSSFMGNLPFSCPVSVID